MEEKKPDWAAIGVIVGIIGLIIAGLTFSDTKAEQAEDKARESPRLVIPAPAAPMPDDAISAPEFTPSGPNAPTTISFRNDGKREALIKQIILSNGTWIRTPPRQNILGAGLTIRVVFEPRHYVESAREFILVLKKPAPVPGEGQWTSMEVALVYPALKGKTFRGRVTVVFDGMEQQHFEDVQIDALDQVAVPNG